MCFRKLASICCLAIVCCSSVPEVDADEYCYIYVNNWNYCGYEANTNGQSVPCTGVNNGNGTCSCGLWDGYNPGEFTGAYVQEPFQVNAPGSTFVSRPLDCGALLKCSIGSCSLQLVKNKLVPVCNPVTIPLGRGHGVLGAPCNIDAPPGA